LYIPNSLHNISFWRKNKTKMCSKEIASKMNHWVISLNEYQIKNNRRELVREHFEKLSELFAGNVPGDFDVDRNPNNFLVDAVEINRRSVDLKGLEKLTELCFFLRKNVNELKTVYKKRCRMSNEYYTESERADLEPELQSLDEDVQQMMDTLNDISGFRSEIKHVLSMYTQYENRYVKLRSMNKSAKFRYQANKMKNNTNQNKLNFDLCNRIYKLVRNCPFISPQDEDSKRKCF